jgi:hypothetical protein
MANDIDISAPEWIPISDDHTHPSVVTKHVIKIKKNTSIFLAESIT